MPTFQPGQSGNPAGRPVGSRNKLQTDFLDTLAADFSVGGKAAIVRCREEKPDIYLRVVASLMPKELEVKRALEELSDDELNAAIIAVRAICAAQEAGEGNRLTAPTEPAGVVPTVP